MSPYFTLAFGKGQEARRQKLIQELQNRGLLDAMQTGGNIKINLNNANRGKSKSGLLMIDELSLGQKNRGDEAVQPYRDTRGTEPTTALTQTNDDTKKIYDEVVKKKRDGRINLGQMVNEYREKTGYFSPAQTRDREKSYQQPQGKKGSYSYRAKGR